MPRCPCRSRRPRRPRRHSCLCSYHRPHRRRRHHWHLHDCRLHAHLPHSLLPPAQVPHRAATAGRAATEPILSLAHTQPVRQAWHFLHRRPAERYDVRWDGRQSSRTQAISPACKDEHGMVGAVPSPGPPPGATRRRPARRPPRGTVQERPGRPQRRRCALIAWVRWFDFAPAREARRSSRRTRS